MRPALALLSLLAIESLAYVNNCKSHAPLALPFPERAAGIWAEGREQRPNETLTTIPALQFAFRQLTWLPLRWPPLTALAPRRGWLCKYGLWRQCHVWHVLVPLKQVRLVQGRCIGTTTLSDIPSPWLAPRAHACSFRVTAAKRTVVGSTGRSRGCSLFVFPEGPAIFRPLAFP